MAAARTMAGNRKRSEGVPVGRATPKTRAAMSLVRVDTGRPPLAGGTGLFRNCHTLFVPDLFDPNV